MEVGIAILILMFIGVLTARHCEKKAWNKGFCRKTGQPWERFDTDSQGGKMYKDGRGNYCDISYRVDKKPPMLEP